MSLFAVSVPRCAGAQEPEVHARNQMRPSRPHWSENLKHTILVTLELEVCTGAWEKTNSVFSTAVDPPIRFNQLFHAVNGLMDANALCMCVFSKAIGLERSITACYIV